MNDKGATRIAVALIEIAGGEVAIPVSLLEVIAGQENLTTWTGLRGGVPVIVLATRLEPEIRAQEEAAYAAWLADQRREAVDEATRDVLAWLGVIDSTDASWVGGFYSAVDLIRGARDLSMLNPAKATEDVPWPAEQETPESWATP